MKPRQAVLISCALMSAPTAFAFSSAYAQPHTELVSLSYAGSTLTISDRGEIVRFDGHSIDTMSRARLLTEMHKLAAYYWAAQQRG